MEIKTSPGESSAIPSAQAGPKVPFGVNEVRLNYRQWIWTAVIVGFLVMFTPRLWTRIERFDTGPDYRLPYELSKDYWLYTRRLQQAAKAGSIVMLGDSVVWGEYVAPDGTWSHFLNRQSGADRFINGGLNGLFPLAEEGLISYYSRPLRHQKVLLHCNVLWMSSPKADLSAEKAAPFNHSRLVAQFSPRIPCYRADANERLSITLERQVNFFGWVNHLQNAYFGQKSILAWTLEDDGGNPPHYPNASKNPIAQIKLVVPSAPKDDPERGPASPRHKAWDSEGQRPVRFDWVGLDSSLQWRAFQRVVERLRARDNDVLVVIGPFNEHMIAEDSRPGFRKIRDGIASWLDNNRVAHVVPETLPGSLYADASHPLTQGYELLARQLSENQTFQNWIQSTQRELR